MTFNSISIIGYLGHDPAAGQTTNGTVSSRFSVATTERRKTADGEMREHTSWFRVTAYGRLAEIAQAHLAKGRQVFVRGSLRLEEYTDKDGVLRFSAEVRATDLILTGAAPAVEAPEEEAITEETPGSIAGEEFTTEPAQTKRGKRRMSA
ncbi:MAG: single-stranded DNA-binding protein [Acidobacteria bacterium]|nr:single-stranded DNA-binding protein [Acidobacteriota bacterium]